MEYYVLRAMEEAEKSDMKRKYGAVLIHRGKIISSGHNYGTCNDTLNKSCVL
jgi:deoxycytidylate deaminase